MNIVAYMWTIWSVELFIILYLRASLSFKHDHNIIQLACWPFKQTEKYMSHVMHGLDLTFGIMY